ncbi:DUF4911 domain-containing protein [Desulfurivibrio sp. D14AmB]|uniref:DUF4911 domain-containing protein n=1 Tax=Desulfurivibrio sp. D14AmB TaxID=3374370 RepID=UPI00376F3D03
MELASRTMIIAPARIGFFRFILEAYDNLALLTTIDEREGRVILRYSEEMAPEVEQLLLALAPQLSPPPPTT